MGLIDPGLFSQGRSAPPGDGGLGRKQVLGARLTAAAAYLPHRSNVSAMYPISTTLSRKTNLCGQSAYLTEHPYGRVSATDTGLPAFTSPIAAVTWLRAVAMSAALAVGLSSIAPW